MTEASRADAALTVLFEGPCACPEGHPGSRRCGLRAMDALRAGGTDIPVCIPCMRCLLAVEFDAPPGRASGSASRYRQTG